jgi:hypothetical protein
MSTDIIIGWGGFTPKTKYSPIIVINIENLRKTVNIGKFKDLVPKVKKGDNQLKAKNYQFLTT